MFKVTKESIVYSQESFYHLIPTSAYVTIRQLITFQKVYLMKSVIKVALFRLQIATAYRQIFAIVIAFPIDSYSLQEEK